MIFGLKKFISQFLMPIPLVCECLILGWILVRFTQYKKTGKAFYLLAFTLFLAFGYGWGRTYLYNLERRYTAFEPTPEQCEALRGTPVVVLGQGMPESSDLPLRYQNNEIFDRRLLEGVRVAKLIPESRLIISMAGEAPDTIKQLFLDEYMSLVNFPTNRVFMFTTARDTSEEAACAKKVISNQCSVISGDGSSRASDPVSSFQFPVSNLQTNALTNYRTNALLLATSASHIPRAMKIFQKQGMDPIPAPCDYTDVNPPHAEWKHWYLPPLPEGRNIKNSERAVYEWLGNLFVSLF
jgi:uncharacterized SAM-binding protein YcdF (DUF218 family)